MADRDRLAGGGGVEQVDADATCQVAEALRLAVLERRAPVATSRDDAERQRREDRIAFEERLLQPTIRRLQLLVDCGCARLQLGIALLKPVRRLDERVEPGPQVAFAQRARVYCFSPGHVIESGSVLGR